MKKELKLKKGGKDEEGGGIDKELKQRKEERMKKI